MKAKELGDLKRSYKEAMDELGTLRTKVGHSTDSLYVRLTATSRVHSR